MDARENRVVVAEPAEDSRALTIREPSSSALSQPPLQYHRHQHDHQLPQEAAAGDDDDEQQQQRYWHCAAVVREGHTLRAAAFAPSGSALALAGNSGRVYTASVAGAMEERGTRSLACDQLRTTHQGYCFLFGGV